MDEAEGKPRLSDRWLRAQRAAVTRGRIAAGLGALLLAAVFLEGLKIYGRLPDQIRGGWGAASQTTVKSPVHAFLPLLLGAVFLAMITYSVRNERAAAGRRWPEFKVLPPALRAFVLAPIQEATLYAGALVALTMALVQRGTWFAWEHHARYVGWTFIIGYAVAILVAAAGTVVSKARIRAIAKLSAESGSEDRDPS